MNVTNNIKMDLAKPDRFLSIHAVQGDTYSRNLSICLYDGMHPWNIPEGTMAAVRYAKPDHTKGYYDTLPDGTSAWEIQENLLTIRLAPQMLTVPGNVKAQIELIRGTHILSTFSLTVFVEPNPAAGVLTSEDYVNWMHWLQDQVRDQTTLLQNLTQTAAQSAQSATTAADLAAAAAVSANASREETAALAAEAADFAAKNEGYTKQESNLRFANAILPTVSGTAFALTDTLEAPLLGLKLFGKTVQNGIPTPEAPVALNSAASSGTVKITVSGTGQESQTLTVSTPNGLPGIPVSSGGNYTDENGQQWICDELDFEKGIYTQRIVRYTFKGTEYFQRSTYVHWLPLSDIGLSLAKVKAALCNWYTFSLSNVNATQTPGAFDFFYSSSDWITPLQIRISTDGFDTVAAFKATLKQAYDAGKPMYCLFALATPVETALSESELTAYADLHTHYPSTAIVNDAGTWMEGTYRADTKHYIDAKIAALTF